MHEYVAAVREGSRGIERFRRAHRRVDLLLIDDVHFLASKAGTQQELLHTFDALGMIGARIVLASDEHPRHVKCFSDALVSRFMSGLVAGIDPPDRRLCEQIVRRLAARRGLELDDAAVQAIVARAASLPGAGAPAAMSVRDLEGLLTGVEALARLDHHGSAGGGAAPIIGAATVRRALSLGQRAAPLAGPAHVAQNGSPGASVNQRPLRPVRLETIISETCTALRVRHEDLVGRGRHPRVVLARSMIAVLARRLTTLSFPEIARGMGRPNHSTIVTACQRVQANIAAGRTAGLADGIDDVPLSELLERLAAAVLRAAVRS
jgi:chromosomal replication initiator protein